MARLRFSAALGFSVTAAALLSGVAPIRAQAPVDLDQGWSKDDQNRWYGASQGSRLIPLAWLQALEQPGGAQPFLADDHIAKFRYLPRPGQLPVGFAVDQSDDSKYAGQLRWKAGQGSKEQWVGFNCSACHTGEITHGQNRIRVDGGPTIADFQGFFETFNRSLVETRDDPQKFSRFAKRVLAGGHDDTPSNRDRLKAALAQLVAWQLSVQRMNQTDLRYGFARLDAFGHIFNKVALVVDAANQKANPSDAPVSYPFLWNVPQHDKVQWNGIAPNRDLPGFFMQPFDAGALARNTGEVIGVFADVQPKAGAGIIEGYQSSIDISNLVAMEQMLSRLRPPRWPSAIFGTPVPTLVSRGEQLFKAQCQGCHAPLARNDLSTKIEAVMTPIRLDAPTPPGPINTDPWMACNAYTRTALTGELQGTKKDFVTGAPLGPEALLADMLTTTVIGALAGRKLVITENIAQSIVGLHPPPQVIQPFDAPTPFDLPMGVLSAKEQLLNRCLTETSPILAYKGRPLTGIWATAPYLHNGSVANLTELLLPPSQRMKSFWLGTREFDKDNVGYVTTQSAENTFLFRTRDVSGRIIDGNSNAGHDYNNAQLSPDDRKALVEYMKTL